MDQHLLKKIQSIKTLRDRAATEGEKDAAQNRLTMILAKHKLTEQDIPDPNRRHTARPFIPGFDFAGFEDILAEFRRAAERNQDDFIKRTQSRTRDDVRPPASDKGKKTSRARFEQALGKKVSQAAWNVVRSSKRQAQRIDGPSNPAAYARAFYEGAGIGLRNRLTDADVSLYTDPHKHKLKSNNPEGVAAGFAFAEKVTLSWFDTNAS